MTNIKRSEYVLRCIAFHSFVTNFEYHLGVLIQDLTKKRTGINQRALPAICRKFYKASTSSKQVRHEENGRHLPKFSVWTIVQK